MSKKLVQVEVPVEFEVQNNINTEDVDNIEIVTAVYTTSSGIFCDWAEAWSLNKVVLDYVADLDKQKRLDEDWKDWIATELESLAKAVRSFEATDNG
jgi:hypothetical protein